MRNTDLEIRYQNVDSIETYVNNAKIHDAEQIEQIKESIREFGFNDPVAVDENNVLIEGHGRLIAAKELGITEIPTITLGHLSEEEKKAYILVHNKLTLNTDFDIAMLEENLKDITDIDMSKYSLDIGEESWFDDADIPDVNKGVEFVVTLGASEAPYLREFLDESQIKYSEKNVR